MFAYWRGPIAVTVEVVGNSFCRGSLALVYTPPMSDAQTTLQTGLANPYATMDIEQTRGFVFRTPFNALTDWLRAPYTDATGAVTAPDDLGRLDLRILNPLRTKGNTGISSLDVNIYVHSDDMHFRVPQIPRNLSPCNPSLGVVPPPPGRIEQQGGKTDNVFPNEEPPLVEALGPDADPNATRLMPTDHIS